MMRSALVLGGHGFIGHHLARDLKRRGFWVRTVDIKEFPYDESFRDEVDEYKFGDLRNPEICKEVLKGPFDEVYQLAAFMGGAGIVFSGNYDAKILYDSLMINLNVARYAKEIGVGKLFYSSSACCYSQLNQKSIDNPTTTENSAYPAYPDSDYGWEKLISERIYQSFNRNYGMEIRIARFHNIMGPEGAWGNGREKAPAAICRKVAQVENGGVVEIWGDGEQTRSFLYISECLEGIRRFMDSDFQGPVNIGSDEMISINNLVEIVKEVAGKPDIRIKHIPGPLGVRGRNSDNRLIMEKLGWTPNYPLKMAIQKTYPWIENQVLSGRKDYSWTS